jgi:hypothetical protein
MSARRLAPFVLLAALAWTSAPPVTGSPAPGARVGHAPAARPDEKTLELKPKWKKGDSARYEMTKTQLREADGKVVRKVGTHAPVEVEVLAADGDGFVLRWTQGSTVFDDPKQDDDPSARALNAILKSVDVELELDPSGTVTGMRNWKDLRGTGHKIQDGVLSQMAKAGTAKATLEQLRKETDKYFASQESIEATFARQPALLAFPFGRGYEPGKTVEYETELPNVLGGAEPFPAKGACTLKAIDKDTNTATIVFKHTPDPKELPKVLRKWLQEEAKKAGMPPPKDLPELELEDVLEYQIDLATGWIKSLTHTRTTKQPTSTQTDTLTLTRKAK